MRKIEQAILDAIDNRRSVRLSIRDRVAVDDETRDIYVYLWDTCIASIGETCLSIDSGGFRTATTKSRLNAILGRYCDACIYQESGAWRIVTELSLCGYMRDSSASGYSFAVALYRPFRDGMSIPRSN